MRVLDNENTVGQIKYEERLEKETIIANGDDIDDYAYFSKSKEDHMKEPYERKCIYFYYCLIFSS